MTCAATPKEVSSIPPVAVSLVNESQIHLVNQGGRLEGVADPFASKLSPRDPAQLRIDPRQQLIERTLVTTTPLGRGAR